MYQLDLDGSKQFTVHYKNHTLSYSTDGTLPNPLEATFAALAACAGVYANKACKALGISAEGIAIDCKPVTSVNNMIVPTRFVSAVRFPAHFTPEQRQRVLDDIAECAVKKLIHDGSSIEFLSVEAT